MSARASTAALIAVWLLAGCAAMRPAPPPGWVPSYGSARTHEQGHGAWGRFQHGNGSRRGIAEGELLAVQEDSTYVLTPGGVVAFATADLRSVTLVPFYWPGGAMEVKHPSAREWGKLRVHARFPRGLPAGLDPRALEGR